MKASPASPSPGDGAPFPLSLRVCPASIPAGIVTSSRPPWGRAISFFAPLIGFEELDFEAILLVRAASAPAFVGPSAKQVREKIIGVREVGVSGLSFVGISRSFGIILVELVLRFLHAGGVDFPGVISPAPLGIGEKVVGARNLLELFFGVLVAGVQSRDETSSRAADRPS